MSKQLTQLVAMSGSLGDPANDYVILGEGNSSAIVDDDSFWVKTSGSSLNGIDERGFVQVQFEPVLALLGDSSPSDSTVQSTLSAAMIGARPAVRPSVETTFHAAALSETEARFIGHTHPTAVNGILCSRFAREAYSGRLFPDEIVVCGTAPIFTPYIDPGIPLAKMIRSQIISYQDDYGLSPKLILMQNHGLVAMGQTADEVLRITAMAVKTARVLLGTYAAGGPEFLSTENVSRIDNRPDEHYRRKNLT
jgi:rhamnose utilization protein RhaD (predicted bifunctional aldolase and dehydrogenase)